VPGGVEGMLAAFSGAGGGLGELMSMLRTFLVEATQLTQASQPDSLPATLHSMQLTLVSLQQFVTEFQPRLATATGALNELLVHVQQDVSAATGKAGRTFDRLETTVADSGTNLKRLMTELQGSLGAMQKTLATTNAFLETNKGEVTKLLGGVANLSLSLQRNMEEMLTRLQQVLTHADTVLVQNDRNLYTTIENLRDTTEQLKATAQQVQTNPSVLLWGTRKTPNASTASDQPTRVLEDRGRVGRYDKLQ
jgi:ATP/maltotriose-dependent transcriptional regulator MalT